LARFGEIVSVFVLLRPELLAAAYLLKIVLYQSSLNRFMKQQLFSHDFDRLLVNLIT